MTNKTSKTSKENREFPHAFIILFGIIVLMGILTYIVPAGEYYRMEVDGRTIIDPNSFHYIERTPATLFDIFTSIPKGINEASALITMIILIGAAIRVFDGSDAIRAAIMKLYELLGDEKSSSILIVIMVFFGGIGAFPSILEGVIPFAPLAIGIALALGYDMLVGIAISLGATVVGWTAGPTNAYTTGIGQMLGGLPVFSGIGFRILILLVLMLILIIFVLRYAKIIKKNPTKSLVYEINTDHIPDYRGSHIEFTKKHKLVLLTFALTVFFVVLGVTKWNWSLLEMSAVYIIGAIVGGLITGYSASKIIEEMLEGGKTIFVGIIAIGLARGIGVVMAEANLTDTLVHAIATGLEGLPTKVTAIAIFFVQTIINFFIPSGSGKAMVTLPVMLPVADLIDLNRQIAILAFQLGDGLSSLCFPTVGALVAFLMYAKVPFNKWLKFIMPFMLISWIVSIIVLIIAVSINYGPF